MMAQANHAERSPANESSTDDNRPYAPSRLRLFSARVLLPKDWIIVHSQRPRVYRSVTIETLSALAEDVAGIFIANGALGCETKKLPGQPIRGKSSRSRLHAYFEQRNHEALQNALVILRKAGMLIERSAPLIEQLEDPGWATMWQKRFEPLPVGRRLLIVPPWDRSEVKHRIVIVIRPGQAFGTGHHASTFGTLNLLTEICESREIARALDVGTGSGIIALAMHKLGARQTIAIDQDAVALENARENADLNHVDSALRLSVAPLSSIRGRFDLITANILSSVLIEMAPQLKSRLRPDGHLILAGILAREAQAVASAYEPELKLIRTRADGRWRALLFKR